MLLLLLLLLSLLLLMFFVFMTIVILVLHCTFLAFGVDVCDLYAREENIIM